MSNEYVPINDELLERPGVFDFTADSALLRSWGEEFSNSFLQDLLYYPMNFNASKPTNIYGEQDKSGMVYLTPTRLRANVEWNPSKRVLANWGIDETRDLVIRTAIKILETADIEPAVGDQFKVEGLFYRVTNVQVESREPASNRPLAVVYVCIRVNEREQVG